MHDIIKHATRYMVLYKEHGSTSYEIWDALYDAYKAGTITEQQRDQADAEVAEYLGVPGALP